MCSSHSGLRDDQRRSLARLLYAVTGGALVVFALLQLFNNNLLLAGGELAASAALLFGFFRLARTPNLQPWLYGYLIPLFAFFNLIIVVPDASMAAFVWILMMPVLAYLLLGKRAGLRLSLPFMLAGVASYAWYLGIVNTAGVAIDLLNLLLCATLMLAFIHLYEQRREEAEGRLMELAQSDALTGLANRNRFREFLTRTIAECQRSNSQYALVLMDIDHFKRVNDSYGHEAGDRVLKMISRTLTERLRATDAVGRLGGEEFGLVLRDVSREDACQLMEQLRLRIADRTLHYRGEAIGVTASFGIAHSSRDGHRVDVLFRTADRRLYQGKCDGRNRVAADDVAVADVTATSEAVRV